MAAKNLPPTADSSLGTILGDLADSTQTLVRQEVELVRAQTTEKVMVLAKTKGVGVGLLAGAGVFALLGLAFLGVMLIFGLAAWFDLSLWIAALIVTLLYFLIAALLALLGRRALTAKPERDDQASTDTTH